MRIGIIGSGHIGGTAAQLFSKAGHEVALSHAGSPDSLREQVASLGPKAKAMTPEQAADFGSVVVLAVPWRDRDQLPKEQLRGKIVVDATNPYTPDFKLYDLGDSTSSEEVAKALPGARIVKAFNTLYADDLASRGQLRRSVGGRTALLVAGNDAHAKKVVSTLIRDIGFCPVDTGTLQEGGRFQQPGSPFYTRIVTGDDAAAALARARAVAEQPAAPSESPHP
ncbi:MAG: NADPH-dependent F420 reductase [Myxococcales bacterium]